MGLANDSSTAYNKDMNPCLVRNCSGEYVLYEVVEGKNDNLGDRYLKYECTRNFRHRAWKIESIGVLHKVSAGRWDKQELPIDYGPTCNRCGLQHRGEC